MRIRILISLLTVIGLAGCTGLTATGAPTDTPQAPVASTAVQTATPMTGELQPAIVPLTLWVPEELDPYGSRPGANTLARQLASFSETYPDLRVEVVVKKAHGRGGLLDFLRTARDAAPSVLPDLIILDATDLEAAAGALLVQPLDELLSPTLQNDRFAFAARMGQVDEQTMGFVIAADTQHLAYRQALFSSPVISWTSVVSSPGPLLFPAGGRERQVNDATLSQYLSAGGTFVDAEDKLYLNRDVMISVFTFYSRCVSTGVISPAVVLAMDSADQSWERFKAGEGAMAVAPASLYWTEADETMAVAPLPTATGQPFALISQAWAIALVAEDPADQGRATLLLDWLIAPDHSAQWTRAAGYLPATYGALQLWDVSETDRLMLRSVLDVAAAPSDADVIKTVGQALQEALELVLLNRATPRQAANAAIETLGR